MKSDFKFIVSSSIKKNQKLLVEFLNKNKHIRFISLFGIDFLGNDTDERIPVNHFIENIDSIFSGGIQTDGSSVNLTKIAELEDAQIDFIIDFDRNWLIDPNYEYILDDLPVSTLKIPVYFKHHSNFYCSRSVLKQTLSYVKNTIISLLQDDYCQKYLSFKKEEIKDIHFTAGTELEFWVKTAVGDISTSALEVSQNLKESYWKRTKGHVRTAMEESLILLEQYGLKPEMGHKEVGGVKGKISQDGNFYNLMQQLEIDWKFNEPLQACDNELLARILIKETFRKYGLTVSYEAKPVKNAAGSGEHIHIGIQVELQSSKMINLLDAYDINHFMSPIGYGALMGLLKHWYVIAPFTTNSISALKRLQPGFEAPIAPVASLGKNTISPSRNRTVLIGLIRSNSPLATRFEVRAPNPHTNIYMAISSYLIAMLDGIYYAIDKDTIQLSNELIKDEIPKNSYLDPNRVYISEDNIYTAYTYSQREKIFGKPATTVWDIFQPLQQDKSLFKNSPLTNKIIDSYIESSLNQWLIELNAKFIPSIRKDLLLIKKQLTSKNDSNSYSLQGQVRNKILNDIHQLFNSSGSINLNRSIYEQFLEYDSEVKFKETSSIFKLRRYIELRNFTMVDKEYKKIIQSLQLIQNIYNNLIKEIDTAL